jgi:hypothetical protein
MVRWPKTVLAGSPFFFGPDGSMMSVKWNNLKVWLRYCKGLEEPIVTPQVPMIFDLGSADLLR